MITRLHICVRTRYRNIISFFSSSTYFTKRSHLPPARSGTFREGAEYQGKCRGGIFAYRHVSVLRESASRIHFWLLDIRTSLAHRVRLGNAVKRSWSHSPCSCARYTVENSYCASNTRILRAHTFEAGAAVFI